MSYNWGPRYIVPSEVLKKYSGSVLLREELDEELLEKELAALGLTGPVLRITNPWYYRRKDATSGLKNGQYQILGLMHVFVKKDGEETAIARENVVEVTIEN
jgi:hypothetical protein